MSKIAVIDEKGNPQPVATAMPMKLVEMAVQNGADIDQLSKLMDMQERWEAREARKSYLDAFAKFQSIVPTITKRKDAHNYKYAPLGDIAQQIKDSLRECGLSYRFEIQDAGEQITVTCIVSHRDGHNEATSMTGGEDSTGSKNTIQSRGSTVSYLQRYTLIGALGLTTADADMDGRISSDRITEDQAAEINKRLKKTGSDAAKFCAALGIADVSSMPSAKYSQADATLKRKEFAVNENA